jgi:hypothetical protein
VVGSAELLDLPGAVRFERVRGQHESGAGELLDEAAGEVTVPGVAMYNIGFVESPGHEQVADKGVHQLGVTGVLAGDGAFGPDALHLEVALVNGLLAEAEDLHGVPAVLDASQFARQVLDVDAGPAIDVRRVFIGQDGDVHEGILVSRWGGRESRRQGNPTSASFSRQGQGFNQAANPLHVLQPDLSILLSSLSEPLGPCPKVVSMSAPEVVRFRPVLEVLEDRIALSRFPVGTIDSAAAPRFGPVASQAVFRFPQAGLAGTGEEATGLLGAGLPGTGILGTGLTGAGIPGTGVQDTGLTGVGIPGTGEQATGLSGAGIPGSGELATGLSGAGIPGTGEQATGLSGVGIPGTGIAGTGLIGFGTPTPSTSAGGTPSMGPTFTPPFTLGPAGLGSGVAPPMVPAMSPGGTGTSGGGTSSTATSAPMSGAGIVNSVFTGSGIPSTGTQGLDGFFAALAASGLPM